MKTFRILPGAAGIIALTATIGFVDGQRELERFSTDKAHIGVRVLAASDGILSASTTGINLDNPAYLVKVNRGDTSREVLIDAITGNVLKS